MRLRRNIFALGVLAVAIVVTFLASDRGGPPQPLQKYGPPDAIVDVSFATRPSARLFREPQSPNRFLENMVNDFTLYVAKLGANSYESVSMSVYPHPLTAGNVNWIVHYYLTGFHAQSWHGHPGAAMDVACKVGDTGKSCPGRTADREIIVGNVIYELGATSVSASEVARFVGSFRLASPDTRHP